MIVQRNYCLYNCLLAGLFVWLFVCLPVVCCLDDDDDYCRPWPSYMFVCLLVLFCLIVSMIIIASRALPSVLFSLALWLFVFWFVCVLVWLLFGCCCLFVCLSVWLLDACG